MIVNSRLTLSPELPATLTELVPPVCAFLMSWHFLAHVYRESRSIFIVDSIPDFLIAIRTFSPDAVFLFFYNEFRELHLSSPEFDKLP